MEQKPVSGLAMLLVTSLLMAAIVVLTLLAGPFGRTPTIRQEPVRSASTIEPGVR